MNAFDAGMIDGMEKTAGPKQWFGAAKKWVKAPAETFRAARAGVGAGSTGLGKRVQGPASFLGALKETAMKHKGQTAALGAGLGAGTIGGIGYLKGRKSGQLSEARRKTAAASNPAQPVKSSMGTGAPEKQRFAPYLNLGGGQAAEHKAGPIESRPQPHPGHVNIGDKSAGEQVAGAVAMDKSPDTGELGSTGGDMVRTKSAAFVAGLDAILDAPVDDAE